MIGYHCIAMLDILGFRQLVKTRRLSWLVDQLDFLFAAAEPKEASCGLLSADDRVRERDLTLGHLHFSDTRMLWTPPMDTEDGDFNVLAFSHICNTVANLIALALINGVPLRGGLALGECYINPAKQLAVGQPIVDAYLLEQEQEWLGAAVSIRAPRRGVRSGPLRCSNEDHTQSRTFRRRLDAHSADAQDSYAKALEDKRSVSRRAGTFGRSGCGNAGKRIPQVAKRG
jgi:hypothetical protein